MLLHNVEVIHSNIGNSICYQCHVCCAKHDISEVLLLDLEMRNSNLGKSICNEYHVCVAKHGIGEVWLLNVEVINSSPGRTYVINTMFVWPSMASVKCCYLILK